jgi:hypothetical protein
MVKLVSCWFVPKRGQHCFVESDLVVVADDSSSSSKRVFVFPLHLTPLELELSSLVGWLFLGFFVLMKMIWEGRMCR